MHWRHYHDIFDAPLTVTVPSKKLAAPDMSVCRYRHRRWGCWRRTTNKSGHLLAWRSLRLLAKCHYCGIPDQKHHSGSALVLFMLAYKVFRSSLNPYVSPHTVKRDTVVQKVRILTVALLSRINAKIPRGPPSPPAPVMHSPTRKVTVKEQQDWKIPPCISNWKNAKVSVRVRCGDAHVCRPPACAGGRDFRRLSGGWGGRSLRCFV